MSKIVSPYYPPRARVYSPLLAGLGYARRRLAMDRMHLPPGVSFPATIASLCIPGLGFFVRGPRLWGQLALCACGFLALVFFCFLGYPVANIAFGLLLSIHVSSLAYLFGPWMADARFRTRLFFSVGLLVALAGLVYFPVRNLISEHLLLPLRIGGKVVVVRRLASPGTLRRGDWLAYSFEESRGEGVYIEGGYGLGPVLAVPGDRLRFTHGSFEINGVAAPRRPRMPESGEWVVPEKHWFAWPEFAISGGHGQVSESAISAVMFNIGKISENQFVGKPYRRWLWRRQL